MNAREFNGHVDKQADALFRFGLSLCKDHELAKDAVQECFAKLWEKKDSVNPEKVKSYLFTTMHNGMMDHFRKSKRQDNLTEGHEQVAGAKSHHHDLSEILVEALSTLPEIQKSVVLLRDYEGYSYEEIGEITKLTEAQVKVYIFRARKKLKAYIGSMEVLI